jgi:hypothetical protein
VVGGAAAGVRETSTCQSAAVSALAVSALGARRRYCAPGPVGNPCGRESLREKHLSKIFDAVKSAQQKRTADAANRPVSPKAERRRCPRWNSQVAVLVQGLDSEDQRFEEEACSANVSELGGLLVMDAAVVPGQVLTLTNKITQEEQKCRVAYVGGRNPHVGAVAVEFANLAPDFWRI